MGHKENLKNNLEYLMRKHNITNEALAEKIGISRSSINRIRMNKGNPTVETLLSICDFFNISIQELTESDTPLRQHSHIEASESSLEMDVSRIPLIKWDILNLNNDIPLLYASITPKEYINIPKNSMLMLNKILKPKHGDYILVVDKQTNINNIAEYIQDISGEYIKSCLSQTNNQYDPTLISLDNYKVLGVLLEIRKIFRLME